MDQDVKGYIDQLPKHDQFHNLNPDDQQKAIFAAHEKLHDYYKPSAITTRAIALQTLYMLEGEDQEFAMLKRQGVKSYSVKGVSVSFADGHISPDVIAVIGRPRKPGRTARLI